MTDPAGHCLKLRLRDPVTNSVRTISSLYSAPNEDIHSHIPDVAINSDFAAGDLNKTDSGLTRCGVYHFRNLTVRKNFKVPDQISDHDLIFVKALMPFKLENLGKAVQLINIRASKAYLKVLANYNPNEAFVETTKWVVPMISADPVELP